MPQIIYQTAKRQTERINKAERERLARLREQLRKITVIKKRSKHETTHNTPTTQPQ